MSLLPTYIQAGTRPAVNIATEWDMYFQSGQLINVPEPKNIYTHEWADAGYQEVYVPPTVTYKAFDVTLKFAFICPRDSYNLKLRDFIYTIGAEEFSIYDDWQKAGLRLRYLSYKETDKYRKEQDIWQVEMKFAVDKPLSYGMVFPSNAPFGGQFQQECFLYFQDGTNAHVGKGERYTKNVTAGSFVIVSPTELKDIL